MKIINVVGARPNFMKVAPIVDALHSHNQGAPARQHIEHLLVHTGQHYDEKMSKFFFDDLGIPKPDVNLEVGSSSHAVQTAEVMKKFEQVCLVEKPSHVLVVGDVNSTIACALVAAKLNIRIIHVEAGLRSFDRGMPEEINRILTDAVSDVLFTTEESGNENLRREGVAAERIFFVGNVMIDTLLKHRAKAAQSTILSRLRLQGKDASARYGVLTLHRPANVDDRKNLQGILEAIAQIAADMPVVFPVHPRTVNRIKDFGLEGYFASMPEATAQGDDAPRRGIYCIEPLGYLDFLHLMANAGLALTDSGGIQEETTILGVPCVTLRENTERPVTITSGTNVLAGNRTADILKVTESQLNSPRSHRIPPLWDGKAAERIVEVLAGRCG